MNAGKQSFFRKVLAQILSSSIPVDGAYVFDLRGRWRYQPQTGARPGVPAPRHVSDGLEEGGAAVTGTCR